MKTRNGFVSNSSSSSFLIFYQDAKVEDLGKEDVYVFDRESGQEGICVYKPQLVVIDYIKELDKNNCDYPDIIKVAKMFEEGDYKVDIKTNEDYDKYKNLFIDNRFCITVIDHWTPDLESFKETYPLEEE